MHTPRSLARLAVSDPCAYLQRLIDGEFGFLTQGGEYVQIHVEPGQKSGCFVIFDGASIRVRLQTARDERLNVLIGDTRAPLGAREVIGGRRVWHYLTGIAAYIDKDLRFGEKRVNMTRQEVEEARRTSVSGYSLMLSNYLERIEALFADARFDEQRDDYEEFLREAGKRTRAAYGMRSRSDRSKTHDESD